MDGDESKLHPCARCARTQRTCCQRAEILVTVGDRARIARHTGRADFWHRVRPTDPACYEHDEDDPEWTALTIGADGARAVLKKREGGDCSFLGPAGCALPVEVRPIVCRLYPFTYTAKGLGGEDPDYCPTEMLDPDRRGMLKVLDMDPRDGERWRAMLYDELRSGEERA